MIVAAARNKYGTLVKIERYDCFRGSLKLYGWRILGQGFKPGDSFLNFEAVKNALKTNGYRLINDKKTTIKERSIAPKSL